MAVAKTCAIQDETAEHCAADIADAAEHGGRDEKGHVAEPEPV